MTLSVVQQRRNLRICLAAYDDRNPQVMEGLWYWFLSIGDTGAAKMAWAMWSRLKKDV